MNKVEYLFLTLNLLYIFMTQEQYEQYEQL